MKLYRFTNDEDIQTWHGTRAEAQALGHEIGAPFRGACRVEECAVPTDKENVLALIRDEAKFTVLRTWKLTARCGLKLQG